MVALCSQTGSEILPDLHFLLYRAILRLECKDDSVRSRSMALVGSVIERMGEVDEGEIARERAGTKRQQKEYNAHPHY